MKTLMTVVLLTTAASGAVMESTGIDLGNCLRVERGQHNLFGNGLPQSYALFKAEGDNPHYDGKLATLATFDHLGIESSKSSDLFGGSWKANATTAVVMERAIKSLAEGATSAIKFEFKGLTDSEVAKLHSRHFDISGLSRYYVTLNDAPAVIAASEAWRSKKQASSFFLDIASVMPPHPNPTLESSFKFNLQTPLLTLTGVACSDQALVTQQLQVGTRVVGIAPHYEEDSQSKTKKVAYDADKTTNTLTLKERQRAYLRAQVVRGGVASYDADLGTYVAKDGKVRFIGDSFVDYPRG